MNSAFPEHRFYSVLAALQVGIIMIGTFAIRFATTESLEGYYKPAPAMAHWIRDWGYLGLLVPAVGLTWCIRSGRMENADERLGLRIALAIVVTLLVGFVFWWLWQESTMTSTKMYLFT